MTRLRPLRHTDLDRLVDLNNSAVPAVPPADAAELGRLAAFPGLALVAERGGSVVGFLLAMDPGGDYESENYRFFAERGPSLYIDRIVIDGAFRGSGAGRALYEAVFDKARSDGLPEVTCEVNLQPPNPASLAFHGRLGFRRIGEQVTRGGAYTVALLAADARTGIRR